MEIIYQRIKHINVAKIKLTQTQYSFSLRNYQPELLTRLGGDSFRQGSTSDLNRHC